MESERRYDGAAKWRRANPKWSYTYFTDDEGGQFIKAHFPAHVFQAYDQLLVGTFKSDLARYCYLYVHGGVWSDLDVQPFDLDKVIDAHSPFDMLIAKDAAGTALWQGLFFTVARNPLLLRAIEAAAQNVLEHYYGCSDLEITGPRLLGRAVAQFYDDRRWADAGARPEKDYVLASNGVRAVVTCCFAGSGRIVGNADPQALDQPSLATGRAGDDEERSYDAAWGDYLKAWCYYQVYPNQTQDAVAKERRRRHADCSDDPDCSLRCRRRGFV